MLACSTFGCAPPRAVSEEWERICIAHGVPLIVDSAAGFGSRDELGQPLGRQGIAEVFSFHATKPLAAGEGGAVFTDDPTLAAEISRQSHFGLDDRRQLHGDPGLNAKDERDPRRDSFCAALDDLDSVISARADRAEAIRDDLTNFGYEFQLGCETSAWQFVPALASSARARDEIAEAAEAGRVQLRAYHQPLHENGPAHRLRHGRRPRGDARPGAEDHLLASGQRPHRRRDPTHPKRARSTR